MIMFNLQAFSVAYIHEPTRAAAHVTNTRLIESSLVALEALSPNLEHYLLQTGGKVRFASITW